MRARHTGAHGRTGIAALGLVAAQLLVLASIDTRYLIVAAGVVMAITTFAAFKLCRDNCVESRLVVASVAAASVVGMTLSSTIGLPGMSRQSMDLSGVALLAAAVLALLTITTEARARRDLGRSGSPYAL